MDRIIDVFPASQQAQVRMPLSMVLQTVISQQLLPSVDGKLIPVFEIMHTNAAIKNLIREGKTHQMDSAIQSGAAQGMISMDAVSYTHLLSSRQRTTRTRLEFTTESFYNKERLRR